MATLRSRLAELERRDANGSNLRAMSDAELMSEVLRLCGLPADYEATDAELQNIAAARLLEWEGHVD